MASHSPMGAFAVRPSKDLSGPDACCCSQSTALSWPRTVSHLSMGPWGSRPACSKTNCVVRVHCPLDPEGSYPRQYPSTEGGKLGGSFLVAEPVLGSPLAPWLTPPHGHSGWLRPIASLGVCRGCAMSYAASQAYGISSEKMPAISALPFHHFQAGAGRRGGGHYFRFLEGEGEGVGQPFLCRARQQWSRCLFPFHYLRGGGGIAAILLLLIFLNNNNN